MAGVKGLAAKAVQGHPRTFWQPAGARQKAFAIKGVTKERMPEMAQMDANLMGAAGFELAFDQGRFAWKIKASHNSVTGHGLPARRPDSHFLPIGGGAAKRGRGHAFAARRLSPNHSLIGSL